MTPILFTDNFEVADKTYGIMLNYEILKKHTLLGLIGYRGLSFGSGVLIQENKLNFKFKTPKQQTVQAISGTSESVTMEFQPNLLMKINSNVVIVPLELSTAIILGPLSVGFGAGADLNFGSTKMDLSAKSNIDVRGGGVSNVTPGEVNAKANIKKQSPEFISPKVMVGPSIGLGPIMIEMPFSYYFVNKGLSVGLTAGIVF
jgi:hypothetical protein